MPSLVSTRSIRPRTLRPGAISHGLAGVVDSEGELEVLGLEAAVALGLAAQVADEVELEPPRRSATRVCLGDSWNSDCWLRSSSSSRRSATGRLAGVTRRSPVSSRRRANVAWSTAWA